MGQQAAVESYPFDGRGRQVMMPVDEPDVENAAEIGVVNVDQLFGDGVKALDALRVVGIGGRQQAQDLLSGMKRTQLRITRDHVHAVVAHRWILMSVRMPKATRIVTGVRPDPVIGVGGDVFLATA